MDVGQELALSFGGSGVRQDRGGLRLPFFMLQASVATGCCPSDPEN